MVKPFRIWKVLRSKLDSLTEYLKNASRPVLLVGSGVRSAGAIEELEQLLNELRLPVLVSRRS